MKRNKNLIGISGRSGGGKDLVASIIEYLTGYEGPQTFEEWHETIGNPWPKWNIKKYADALKDILCILIGCTRRDLEDRTFKESELGPEWDHWEWYETNDRKQKLSMDKPVPSGSIRELRFSKMTPRKLMQKLGTECGRQMIHPNIWVNALFSTYKERAPKKFEGDTNWLSDGGYMHTRCLKCKERFMGYKRQMICNECIDANSPWFPHWIISDVRFPLNEGGGVSDRGGINIGVKRKFSLRFPEYAHLEIQEKPYEIPIALQHENEDLYKALTHESEELMGDFEWCDYTIVNDGTLIELVEAVRAILEKEEIL